MSDRLKLAREIAARTKPFSLGNGVRTAAADMHRRFGLADIICESIALAFHDSIMPVQNIRSA
jgi:hypothetical protein